jgi:hypothetical protein
MSDLVVRLRASTGNGGRHLFDGEILEAAAEIERLRAALDEIRVAASADRMAEIARRALERKE